jgi:glyoxylase-like metal-dependent hydrolase (beta-lactamase superfamily II)
VVWVLSLSALGAIAYQSGRPPGATPKGPAFTFNKIREGVYHAVGTGTLTVGCNAAVIVNDDDVLVVDSHISPAAAWALVDEIKTLTPKSVRYVVNTHFHFDHTHGNQVFPPGVEIIGHEFTREMIAKGRSKSGRSYEDFVGGIPARLDALRAQVAAATDPAERRRLSDRLAILENHKAATDAVVPTPPSVTLSQSMVLYRGGREIRLLFLGRGHTAGDVVVHLPHERVVITGDLLTAGVSYLGDGYLVEWPETLERLKSLDFDVVLPGHGQAFTDRARIDHFESYLRDFWAQAQKLHASGASAEDASRRIDMRTHAGHYSDIRDVGVSQHSVDRAYELIEGR